MIIEHKHTNTLVYVYTEQFWNYKNLILYSLFIKIIMYCYLVMYYRDNFVMYYQDIDFIIIGPNIYVLRINIVLTT